MLTIALGQSDDIDSSDAVGEVIRQCREQLGSARPQAGFLFAGVDHEFDVLLARIDEAFPGLELIGCTTDGEISSTAGYSEDSINLTLLHSEKIKFKAGVARDVSTNPGERIKEAVGAIKDDADWDPRLCFTFPAGLTVSASLVVDSFRDTLGENFPILGGVAGDQWRFETTHQFFKAEALSDAAPFLLLGGPVKFSYGVDTGWDLIGEPATVTGSEGQVIHTIDDHPAVAFFRKYLGEGDLTSQIVGFPLAVKDGPGYYLRSPAAPDAETGNVPFFGEVPQGAEVQLTTMTRDEVVTATGRSVAQAVERFPGGAPALAICFSCAARKQVLGTRTGEECRVIQDRFPGLKVAGFYTYGEIAPVTQGSPARLHNETFVSVLLGEE